MNFIAKKRPPEYIRPKLDIGYKIDGQSIYVLEIRPQWNKPKCEGVCSNGNE